MSLHNFSKNNDLLAEKIVNTDSFFKKAQGLIGTKHLDDLTTWYFKRCPSVHTCFMSIPIDVIFVDKQMKVTRVIENLRPWRVTWPFSFKNYSCFEFAGGALSGRVDIGDKLYVRS